MNEPFLGFMGLARREKMCVLWRRTHSRKRRRHLARQIARRRLREFTAEMNRYEFSNHRQERDPVTGLLLNLADGLDKQTGKRFVSVNLYCLGGSINSDSYLRRIVNA